VTDAPPPKSQWARVRFPNGDFVIVPIENVQATIAKLTKPQGSRRLHAARPTLPEVQDGPSAE